MNCREMFRQTSVWRKTPKHKLGNRTSRWPKVEEDSRCPSYKKYKSSNAKGKVD